MNRKVINRKNIVIGHDLWDVIAGQTNPLFSKNIHLTFQPDTMVVKLINALSTADPSQRIKDVHLIYCVNLNEYIGSFWDGSTSTPNLTFDVRNATFNTEWKFESRDWEGDLDSESIATIAIHLEFLQHEEK